jgi:SsrA-binding protein
LKDNKSLEKETDKIIATNRKARYEYHIVDSIEAGLVLLGSEVKSLREGKANISDCYAKIKKDEIWVIGLHISHYKQDTLQNLDPVRDRKLLLHKTEIKRLTRRIEEKGMTLIPLRLYFKKNIAKLELGIARGKRQYDKKASIAQKDLERDMEREQKKYKYKL